MRHGRYDYTDLEEMKRTGKFGDPGLNAQGKKEIGALAKSLKTLGITAIHSSSAQRARDTAETIGRELSIEPVFYPGLKDTGLPEGERLVELITRELRGEAIWYEEWIVGGYPGFESPERFQQRVQRTVEEIARNQKGTLLIVGHEEVIWAIMSWINNISFKEAAKTKVGYGEIREFTRKQLTS